MACPPPSKKVRRPNFIEAKVLTLIEEVKKREHVILSKLDNTVTARSKEFAWEEVTSCVNAVSTTKRKPDEVKTKFKDLKFLVKKKAGQLYKEIHQTGKNIMFPLYDILMSHISCTNVQPCWDIVLKSTHELCL